MSCIALLGVSFGLPFCVYLSIISLYDGLFKVILHTSSSRSAYRLTVCQPLCSCVLALLARLPLATAFIPPRGVALRSPRANTCHTPSGPLVLDMPASSAMVMRRKGPGCHNMKASFQPSNSQHRRDTTQALASSASTTLDLGDNAPVPLHKLTDPHPLTVVLRELYRMTRPLTIPGEIGLALGGSLLAAPCTSTLTLPLVWLVAFFSAATGAGSMVINDYFDFRAGADRLKSKKPLTRGTVHPEQALAAASSFYMCSLFLASVLLHDFVLRALVVSSLMATFFYTPLLKAIPLIKNVVVALVISQAIIAGGLATGNPAHLSRTLLPGPNF